MKLDPLLVTVADAATLLSVSTDTVLRYIKERRLVAQGKGSGLRVTIASIRSYEKGESAWHRESTSRNVVIAGQGVSSTVRRASGGLRKSIRGTTGNGDQVILQGRKPKRGLTK
jgi:hypothetical protein